MQVQNIRTNREMSAATDYHYQLPTKMELLCGRNHSTHKRGISSTHFKINVEIIETSTSIMYNNVHILQRGFSVKYTLENEF